MTKMMQAASVIQGNVRMYSSRIVDSTDPDLFADSIRPIDTELTITERGAFRARSMSFSLGRVWAQRGRERLASLKHIALHRYGVLFLTEPGPSMFVNGAEVGIDQIAVGRVGRSKCPLENA
jgi:hypothetical protein